MKRLLCLLFVVSFGCTSATDAPQPDDLQVHRLPRSTPEAQGVSSGALIDFVTSADRDIDQMNSFMLLRHGHVIAEGWWAPYGPEHPHMLYSLSKSFTSTAVGLAVSEGKFSIHDPVLAFFQEDAPVEPGENLASMRVHDLLRMSAGHEVQVSMYDTENWTEAFLAHPVPHLPGTHFQYNTPATYMLSAIVQKRTGETVLDYLRPRLFEPLGIENPTWGTSPQGVTLGGFGLNIRTGDIARFGQLYLQRGQWNGEQLIPAEWVDAATKLQTSNGSNPESDWNQGYGYQFWRSRFNAYRGDGAFGQYCLVMPDQDAVVAVTSGVPDMQEVLDLVFEKLLPAFKDEPLDENSEMQQQLTSLLASLRVPPQAGNATSALATEISGVSLSFSDNERGIVSATLALDAQPPSLLVVTEEAEDIIALGTGDWETGTSRFSNGLSRMLDMPTEHAVAASGAWTSPDTYAVKLVLYETPFYTNMEFQFDGDRVYLSSEHHVAFGPTELPVLAGRF